MSLCICVDSNQTEDNNSPYYLIISSTIIFIFEYNSFIDVIVLCLKTTDTQGSEVDVQVDDVLKLVEDFSRLH